MSTVSTHCLPSPPFISHENLLFNYPDADVILRSRDSHEFHVHKIYIVHASPILGEKILTSPNPQPEPTLTIHAEQDVEGAVANAPCIVQFPIEGAILFSLLTYIFQVPQVLPSTVEQVMELLSVAQMYKMDNVLTQIRNHIAQQEPPFIREETAYLIYSLSLKHGLRTEALQAARRTLGILKLTINDLAKENKLDVMPGAFLHELWKYHQRVRSNLTIDLGEFKKSIVPTIPKCCSPTDLGLPCWLDLYIYDIESACVPTLLDINDFYNALSVHLDGLLDGCHNCMYLLRSKIRELWKALTAVVYGSIAKAESGFPLLVEGTRSDGQTGQTREATSLLLKYSNMPNADVILQSSDLVNFRVHSSVLVTSSPLFRDMFSLPQPQDGTRPSPYELPVVHLPEDAEVLNSLFSTLYPVPPEIPHSRDNILALLAAAKKYDMDAAQSAIRMEINRKGLLSSTNAAEVFQVYAVACNKGLIPEMESSARLSLAYPLTFESLGDGLQSFEGWALRDLANFRRHSIRTFASNLKIFLECCSGPSKIWAGCHGAEKTRPYWLSICLRTPNLEDPDCFTKPIPTTAQLCDMYFMALQEHIEQIDCKSCMRVHILQGKEYCEKLKGVSESAQVWNVSTCNSDI